MRPIVPGVVAALVASLVAVVPAGAEPAATTAEVRPELVAAARSGPVSAIVVLDAAADLSTVAGDHDAVVAELKRVAAQTQPAVRAALPTGVTVRGSLWVTNALVVDVPAASISALSRVPGVAELALNTTVRASGTPAAAAGHVVGDHTWGIDTIQADRVWHELGVTGTGVRVAVLDTGLDATHADLAGRLATDDPADPTYPGGWITFDGNGNPARSTPSDEDGHGTHVSGTVVGGAASGVAIGVAPGATLMHGQVIPGGEGTWAQVLAGMQWSIDPFDWHGNPAGKPADVVNMSIGVRGYLPETVPVTRAIRAAGTFPAFAIGNECEPGVTSSPANVYDGFGVGATDRAGVVPWWSCGGVVHRGDWADPPAEWPESYVKPDVSAPGTDVLSATPGGGYATMSGTSMATPHVAGTVALMRSAAPGLSVDDAVAALRDTSIFTGTTRPDDRIGSGRIDALAAVRAVAGASAVTGVVTDSTTRRAIAGATVTDHNGRSTTTGADGRYRMPATPGRQNLTVSAFTYRSTTVRVTVPNDGTATADARLAGDAAGRVSGTVTYGGHGVPGATVTVLGGPHVTTGEDGRYTIDRLPPGDHKLRVATNGLPDSGTVAVTVRDRRSATADVDLRTPPTVERASLGAGGAEAHGSSSGPDMSADGRFVAFDSYAEDLVDGDANARQDVFLRDRRTGTTDLVSLATDGTQGDNFSSDPSVSDDGRYVAFESYADNLVPDDTPFTGDVFLRDRETGTTTRLSQAPDGTAGDGLSTGASVSADGTHVAFASWSTNLVEGDTNGVADIFVYDVASGTLARVSDGDGYSEAPALSGDGRYVAFTSTATNLVAGDTNGWKDVFVRDVVAGTTSLVSVASDGTQSNHEAQQPSISDDGNVVVFHGFMSNLTTDTNGTYDVFAHDRSTGKTTMVSVSSSGEQSTGSSVYGSVSADGRYVAFASGGVNLAGGDVNGAIDVFVRDLTTGETTLVSARSDGGATDRGSLDPLVSADGRLVAFSSEATNLADGDTNLATDVFVVDRFPPAEHAPRFALSELTVSHPVVSPGATVTVSARVTNIGAAAGGSTVPLSVDDAAQPARSASLAPGRSTVVSWVVPAGALGGHDVRVGPLFDSFRVRTPSVRVTVSSVDGRDPLRGATVQLVAQGSPRPGGVTDRNGAVTAESQFGSGVYTIVVTRPTDRHQPGYLLVKQVRVDHDTTVTLAPRTRGRGGDSAALLDLRLDKTSDTHEAWTYLRHELTAPVGFAFAPGQVVATTGAYELREVHEVPGFERDWWAVSDVQQADFGERTTYRRTFGGAATATLTATGGPTLSATWSVTDAHGNPFALMTHTPLRAGGVAAPTPPPATLDLADLPRMIRARATQPEEVILRVYDASGTQVAGGGLTWEQRQFTRDMTGLPAGEYRVELSVATGEYPPGQLTAEAGMTMS